MNECLEDITNILTGIYKRGRVILTYCLLLKYIILYFISQHYN